MTECTQSSFQFAGLYRREVVAQFDGGDITTDGVACCCARWIDG